MFKSRRGCHLESTFPPYLTGSLSQKPATNRTIAQPTVSCVWGFRKDTKGYNYFPSDGNPMLPQHFVGGVKSVFSPSPPRHSRQSDNPLYPFVSFCGAWGGDTRCRDAAGSAQAIPATGSRKGSGRFHASLENRSRPCSPAMLPARRSRAASGDQPAEKSGRTQIEIVTRQAGAIRRRNSV